MPDLNRWVVVSPDHSNKTIVGGPYIWDGETNWQPPDAGELMREDAALAAGYAYPPQPEPEPAPE